MADRFSLELNIKDWSLLDDKAVAMGFKNSREMINAKILELAADKRFQRDCPGGRRKRKNNYAIPNNLHSFYANLSCTHSSNISKIFFRFIIVPIMDGHIPVAPTQEDGKGA